MKDGQKIEIVRRVNGRGGRAYHPGEVVTVGVEFDAQQCAGLLARRDARPYTAPPADKMRRGPRETKALADYSEVDLGAEFERRTQRPFVETFATADLLDELQRRGAANPTEDAHDLIEVVSVALPSLAEVKAKRGKFDAHAANLRLVGVKGRSWAQLAEDYEEWINGLLAPLSETVEGAEAPAPEGDA